MMMVVRGLCSYSWAVVFLKRTSKRIRILLCWHIIIYFLLFCIIYFLIFLSKTCQTSYRVIVPPRTFRFSPLLSPKIIMLNKYLLWLLYILWFCKSYRVSALILLDFRRMCSAPLCFIWHCGSSCGLRTLILGLFTLSKMHWSCHQAAVVAAWLGGSAVWNLNECVQNKKYLRGERAEFYAKTKKKNRIIHLCVS